MSESLPPRANLEHLKKEAKALLRKDRKKKLADVQRTIARKYGFASWAKLKEHVSAVDPVDPLKLAHEAFHKDDAKTLRQLMQQCTATMMYLDENKQFYPQPAVGPEFEDWIYWHPGRDLNQGRLVKFQGKFFNANLYRCPSDQNWTTRAYKYSYTMNYRIGGWRGGGIASLKLPHIIRPSDKILYIDEADLTVDDGAWAPDHFMAGDGHNLLSNRHDKTRETITNGKLGRGCVVYCDGHFEYAERWKSLDPYFNDPRYTGPVMHGSY